MQMMSTIGLFVIDINLIEAKKKIIETILNSHQNIFIFQFMILPLLKFHFFSKPKNDDKVVQLIFVIQDTNDH